MVLFPPRVVFCFFAEIPGWEGNTRQKFDRQFTEVIQAHARRRPFGMVCTTSRLLPE